MKNVRQIYKSASLILLLGIAVTASAWQYTDKKQKNRDEDKYDQRDTTKSRKYYHNQNEYRINDMDMAMDELDNAMKNLKVELKGLDSLNINIEAEVNAALAKIDFDKMKIETEKALKEVDWDQIRKSVDVSLKQAQAEMKKVNMDQIKASIKVAQDQVNSEAFRQQFNSVNLRKQIEDGMSKAKDGLATAKKDLQSIKALTGALQADGLIDKKRGYTVEFKDGSFIINGTTQSKEITEKYHKYFNKDSFKIVSDGEGVISL
ncbi:MAG: hypothetical protein J0I41_01190 [Filimonas sp.]|nr:hypothetical protein [Filimonas sp.]